MATTTVINKFGHLTDWNKITVNLLGRDLEGIIAIKYEDEQEIETVHGAGKYPIGFAEKDYKASLEMTLIKEEVDGLQLSVGPGKRIQDIEPFDIVVEYQLKEGRILKDRIRNCMFLSNENDLKTGGGKIEKKMKMWCSHIEWNII